MITSKDSKTYKELKKIKDKGIKTGFLLLEGPNTHEQLKAYDYPYELILREDSFPELEGIRLSEFLFKNLTQTEHSQGMILKISPRVPNKIQGNILYLEEMKDPGNLGTILRSASAFGLDTLCLGPGSVSLYNEKVLRSSLSAFLNLNIIEGVSLAELKTLEGYSFYGALLEGEDFREVKPKKPWVLMIGNEAKGLTPEAISLCDAITIPMKGAMESLNASVAGSILLESFLRIE